MNLLQELNWHEGLFLCPHHLQQFQREISNGLVQTTRMVFDFPYGVLECEINKTRFYEENVLEFFRLKVIMPSGFYIDNTLNSYIPPFPLEGLLTPSDENLILNLGLPFLGIDKANLSSREEVKNDKISRIYSNIEKEYTDENTGHNPKLLSIRKLNPRIFSEKENVVDYEFIPLLKIKKGKVQQYEIDKEFSPPCFKISGSTELKELIKDTVIHLVNHVKDYKKKLHSIYEFSYSLPSIQIPLLKLNIISSYSAELDTIISKTNPTPFNLYLIFKKLVAELTALIPEYTKYEINEYNHDNPYFSFIEIKKILEKVFSIELLKQENTRLKFVKNEEDIYQIFIPENKINDRYEYFVSVKTVMSAEYLIKRIEEGFSFKCLPLDSVKMKAVPGFKLNFVSNLPKGVFREYNEYYFRINKFDNELWDNIKETGNLSVIERLSKEEGVLDEINLVIYHGGK